jgi:hypothetical protein
MKNNTGVFNSQSYLNEYKADLRRAVIKAPAMFTITAYAEKIAGRYEAMLTLIQGAKAFDARLVTKGEHLVLEYKTQLIMLADYADKLAEVGITA